jgi:hypothetical protein
MNEKGILVLGALNVNGPADVAAAGITFGVALILLAIGTIPVMRTLLFLRTAEETTGTIVELREGQGEGPIFQAVVEFKTHEGQTIRWTQPGWRSRFPGNVGDEIRMKYNPQNPNRARTADMHSTWVFGVVFSSFGLLLGAIGLWRILDTP